MDHSPPSRGSESKAESKETTKCSSKTLKFEAKKNESLYEESAKIKVTYSCLF